MKKGSGSPPVPANVCFRFDSENSVILDITSELIIDDNIV
jgi:hypothetical protein